MCSPERANRLTLAARGPDDGSPARGAALAASARVDYQGYRAVHANWTKKSAVRLNPIEFADVIEQAVLYFRRMQCESRRRRPTVR